MSDPVWRRLFRLWRSDVERDVDDEVAFHFQMRVEQFMADGMSRQDAENAARAQFGNERAVRSALVAIGHRTNRRRNLRERMDGVAQDVVIAMRALRRAPLFTLGVIITLGLGIGANATMFSIIDGLMLRGPAHVQDASQVKRLYASYVVNGQGLKARSTLGYVWYTTLRDHATSIASIGAYTSPMRRRIGTGADAPTIQVASVSWDLFPTLGVRPLVGRFFGRTEDSPPDGARVVVISEGLWRTRFAGVPSVIGREITLTGERFTIVGVAPDGFTGAQRQATDAWVPLSLVHPRQDWPTTYSASWLTIVARMKPGVDPRRVEDEMTRIWRAAYTGGDPNVRELVASARPLWYGPQGEPTPVADVSRWLMGVAVIVLIVTCVNVANLMVARMRRRGREIAVRVALGASAGRLARFIMTEAILVTLAGVVFGLFVTLAGGRLMRATLLDNLAWDTPGLDARVFAFTLIVAVLVALCIGAVPVISATRVKAVRSLMTGDQVMGATRARVRLMLSAMQAALCVVLLVGAGLFVQSLSHARALDLGFQANRVVRADVSLTPIASATLDAELAQQKSVMLDAVDRLSRTNGIEAAAIVVGGPFGNSFGVGLKVPGRDSIPHLPGGGPYISAVTPSYFPTVGTPLRRGRLFSAEDRDGSALVVIVNETMARSLWPNENPIGKCLLINSTTCAQVVGVVSDVHRRSLRELPSMQYYVPFGQERGIGGAELLVRPHADASAAFGDIRRIVLGIPGVERVRLATIQESVDPEYRPWRLGASMFGVFGLLALVIASVGLYSVIAYLVSDRTRELGIRLALGASRGRIQRDVVSNGVVVTALGVALGTVIAFAAARYIEPLLFDVSARNPAVYVVVAASVIAIAALAAWSPARRASRVDPVTALRAD